MIRLYYNLARNIFQDNITIYWNKFSTYAFFLNVLFLNNSLPSILKLYSTVIEEYGDIILDNLFLSKGSLEIFCHVLDLIPKSNFSLK